VREIGAVLRHTPHHPLVVQAAFRAYAVAKSLPQVLALWRQLIALGDVPSPQDCETMVEALADAGRKDDVLKVLGQLRGWGRAVTSPILAVLHGMFARQGRLEEARGMLRLLERQRDVPVTAYHTMISALCNADYVDEADGLVASMDARGLPVDHALNLLLLKRWQQHDVPAVERLLSQAADRDVALTADVAAPLLRVFGPTMAPDDLARWVHLVGRCGTKLDEDVRLSLTRVAIHHGLLDVAEYLLRPFPHASPSAAPGREALALAYIQAGQLPEAARVIRSWKRHRPTRVSPTAPYDYFSGVVSAPHTAPRPWPTKKRKKDDAGGGGGRHPPPAGSGGPRGTTPTHRSHPTQRLPNPLPPLVKAVLSAATGVLMSMHVFTLYLALCLQ